MFFARLALVFSIAVAGASSSPGQDSPDVETFAVVLRYVERIPLGQDESRELLQKSMDILRSSNFNSSSPQWKWDQAKIDFEYGQSVSGKHVLITFGKAATIPTIGGHVSARELVIGLDSLEVASPVHTVDADGRIVGHAKYQGHLCAELAALVRQIAARARDTSVEPTR
jgi:hypothetical protein